MSVGVAIADITRDIGIIARSRVRAGEKREKKTRLGAIDGEEAERESLHFPSFQICHLNVECSALYSESRILLDVLSRILKRN